VSHQVLQEHQYIVQVAAAEHQVVEHRPVATGAVALEQTATLEAPVLLIQVAAEEEDGSIVVV
jgi:hypothetical protein